MWTSPEFFKTDPDCPIRSWFGYPKSLNTGATAVPWGTRRWDKLAPSTAGFALALFVLLPWFGSFAAPPPTASIGQNFTASTYTVNSMALPPDSDGAIGPQHFAEFINGSFSVFNKTNGQSVKEVTDLHFWANAGVVISTDDVTTDPRIIYDPTVQRWFASMIDASAGAVDPTLNANDFLFAVSAGPDPTGPWHGFLFSADPDKGYFADFPTLGLDQDAVYLAGDFFHGSNTPAGPGLVSLPKADLTATSPKIDNRTWFGVMDYAARGEVLQPATCVDGSAVGQVLSLTDIGNDSNPHSNLVSFAVQNSATPKASLSAATFIPTEPWVVPDNVDFGAPLLVVTQPDDTTTLMANDARLSARTYVVGGVLYAVHSTQLATHIGIRWYRVRVADHALVESGTIADPNMDLFFPSIAVNPNGVVVIACNGSGPGTMVSCFAVLGQTDAGGTTFGTPVLLKSGAASYHGDDELLAQLFGDPGFSRWGDYSATTVDPVDANRFWTIQMFPSDAANTDVWSTQVTELIVSTPAVLAIQRTGGGVQLSWPSNLTGYRLQSSTNLALVGAWTNVTATAVTNAGQVEVTLPTSATNQFFRLAQ